MSETNVQPTVRQVKPIQWEGKKGRSVVIERSFATSVDDLWDAIVTPERLARWFLPVSGDLVEGGQYQLEGNAGGTIRRCDAPHYLELSWEIQGGIGWITLTLAPLGDDSTRLVLEHIGEDEAHFLEFWAQYGPGSVGVGWDTAFMSLDAYIEQGDDYEPFDENAWVATAEGQAFMLAASDGWVAAAIAFGTDPEAARAAGKQTYAFFTGTPVE